MREVKIMVHLDGTTTSDFTGFVGPSCLDEAERLRRLLAALGVQCEVTNFQPKPELGVSQGQQDQQPERIRQEQGGTQ